jgi:vitamin B12/bleomycin/antimicrobial peptide transport system ATP-binding/permease protein
VREQLPDCTLISVGHGGTLDRMHTNELTLVGDGTWETRTLVV